MRNCDLSIRRPRTYPVRICANKFFPYAYGPQRGCQSARKVKVSLVPPNHPGVSGRSHCSSRDLNGVRNNPDENIRRLLNCFDYGPIQTAGGNHVAVVLFPAGTDWHSTGTVLGPWPYQTPQAFPIDLREVNLTIYALYGGEPEPDVNIGNFYPQLSGGESSYPAMDLQSGQTKPIKRILMINSTVTVMVQMADGRRVGVMPGPGFVNELAGEMYFYTVPNTENLDQSWSLSHPDLTAEASFLIPKSNLDQALQYAVCPDSHSSECSSALSFYTRRQLEVRY